MVKELLHILNSPLTIIGIFMTKKPKLTIRTIRYGRIKRSSLNREKLCSKKVKERERYKDRRIERYSERESRERKKN